ncbi:hypothetical protein B6S59_31555 [Pseudomonas sp. A46]|nr:hypothetical protein B6S59_31555 [Pseudomonas sp. A46]
MHVANQSQLAEQALQYIGQLYEVEREGRELLAEQRRQLRQDKARPIIDGLHSWMIGQRQFLSFLKEIDASVPAEMPIHLVMDNYATHKTDKVKAWLAARPRYSIHFTPTSASWLNLVERFFSTLSEKWIKRQAHVSVKDLESSIEHYLKTYNQNPKPFRWYRKAEDILASVARAARALGK